MKENNNLNETVDLRCHGAVHCHNAYPAKVLQRLFGVGLILPLVCGIFGTSQLAKSGSPWAGVTRVPCPLTPTW